MREQTYAVRAFIARKTAIEDERMFRWQCKRLGIDPDAVSEGPLQVIAERQAQVSVGGVG